MECSSTDIKATQNQATHTLNPADNSLPPTILQCFNEKLPSIRPSDNIKYKAVQPSGKTTADAVPPWVLIRQETQELVKIAEAALRHPALIESRLGRHSINKVDETFYGNSEMDIVTASLAAIILPIKEVLNVLYPNKFEVASEYNKNGKGVADQLEEIVGGIKKVEAALRCDFIYKIPNTHATEGKTIAVLEYKRRGMIRYADWTEAVLDQGTSEDKIKEKINTAKDSNKTWLRFNGLSYSKQVSAYAVSKRCKHVALFDWDHALFFMFNELALGEKPRAGDRAEFILSTEDKNAHKEGEYPFVEIANLRKMMLGWVLRAFRDALGEYPDA